MSKFVSLCTIPKDPELRLNILLFGCSGVGKSCFLNSIWTNETDEPVKLSRRAKTRQYKIGEQCTLLFHQYNIEENSGVKIFDTLGWTPKVNYGGKEFEMILNGRVEDKSVCSNLSPTEAVDERIIDIVCFVLDGVNGVTEEVVIGMKPFVDKAIEKKKKVCVVITKMDKVVSFSTKVHIEQYDDCCRGEEFRAFQLLIAPILGLTEIFPMINYTYLDNGKSELIMLLKEPIISFFTPEKLSPSSKPLIEPLSLTKGEEHITTLRYPDDHPKKGYNEDLLKEFILSQDPRNVILSCQSFYHAIRLGDRIFRLFVVRSFVCSDRDIIGIVEDEEKVYFETTLRRTPNIYDLFQESFSLNPNRISDYVFLTDDGRPSSNWDESTIDYLRLDIKSLPPFIMKKKGFGKFQVVVENQNQMKKFLCSMSNKNEDYERKMEDQEKIIHELRESMEDMKENQTKMEEKNETLQLDLIKTKELLDEKVTELKFQISQVTKINEEFRKKQQLEEEERRKQEEEQRKREEERKFQLVKTKGSGKMEVDVVKSENLLVKECFVKCEKPFPMDGEYFVLVTCIKVGCNCNQYIGVATKSWDGTSTVGQDADSWSLRIDNNGTYFRHKNSQFQSNEASPNKAAPNVTYKLLVDCSHGTFIVESYKSPLMKNLLKRSNPFGIPKGQQLFFAAYTCSCDNAYLLSGKFFKTGE